MATRHTTRPVSGRHVLTAIATGLAIVLAAAVVALATAGAVLAHSTTANDAIEGADHG